MTAAISSQNFFFQKVIKNNIATRDVIAEKDIKVVDTVKEIKYGVATITSNTEEIDSMFANVDRGFLHTETVYKVKSNE